VDPTQKFHGIMTLLYENLFKHNKKYINHEKLLNIFIKFNSSTLNYLIGNFAMMARQSQLQGDFQPFIKN
jgi:hypothetical protein